MPAVKKVKKVKSNAAKIYIKKYADATQYQLFMRTGKKGKYKRIKTIKGTSYTCRKLRKKKTYYYRVRVVVTDNGKTYFSPYSKAKKFVMK